MLGAIPGGGGHGDVGVVSRWPLAVGRLVLLLAQILHSSRNNINEHTQRIFSGLKYLGWPKFYSPCPDRADKNLGYFVFRPDLDLVYSGLNPF